MSIPRKTLTDAAFWAHSVCLDCEAIIPLVEEDEAQEVCPGCSSTRVYPAALIVEAADLVEDSDD